MNPRSQHLPVMATATAAFEDAWSRAAEQARTAAERKEPPLVWAVSACSSLQDAGIKLPSIDLCRAILSEPPSPALMPFVDHCIAGSLVFPLQALALLTAKVIPVRQEQPESYMMYLNLLNAYVFSLPLRVDSPCSERLVKAVLEALELNDGPTEFAAVGVQFFLVLVWRLVDASAEDWSAPSEKGSSFMVDDFDADTGRKRQEEVEEMKRRSSLKALELVTKLMQNKRTCVLLRLARRNFIEQWSLFVQRLQYLEAVIQDASLAAPIEAGEVLQHLAGAIRRGVVQEFQPSQRVMYKALVDTNSSMPFGTSWGVGRAAAWLPFDIFMEDTLEGRRVPATSTIEALADLIKSLQAVQGASWHDLFLGLWTAALRHVNREREHIEGPKPHVDSRLCMLLFIVPLASAAVIEEEEAQFEDKEVGGIRRAAFASSLQVLAQFEGLLCPPPIAVPAANQAAMKAAAFKSSREMHAPTESGVKAVGNMRHLIVEVCISRGLLDTSAYLWPGYAVPNAAASASPPPPSLWSAFMDGAPLSASLVAALAATPASSLAELEKLYQLAIGGSDDERVAAATILCGATLIRSWNIQEHAVRFAVRLLSPPVTSSDSRSGSHLIPHASMISATLGALTEVDAVQVLSLYGMFPELAAALLPICETFGSMSLTVPLSASSREDVSAHMVFSLAFLLLLRLWKFHRPPLEHRLLGIESPLGGDLSLDYILQQRNESACDHNSSGQPVTLDSFPKLKAWYSQNQACVASTLSGLVRNDPVHQLADRLLAMMFKKVKGSASAAAGTPATPVDDASARPTLPAWDIMTAVPFVLDAVLTACGHGRLSSRDLTTGLRDLVDFLPASIATIVSYFTAEVTRGLWKYAPMNGNEWPSPAANLHSVEAEIKHILAATGVQVPKLVTGSLGNAPVSLPLPLAAFLSLTITFKQDKPSELVLGVAGPALESTAGGSSWPSQPVVAALWAQKIKRWHSFIVFSATRTVFKHDKGTVKQLLRSCFSVTLGSTGTLVSKLQMNGGVGALLGHGGTQGGQYPLAPGILYLRIYPALHEIVYVADEILMLVVDSVRDLMSSMSRGGNPSFPRTSLANSMAWLLQASTLGASLLHISGGSALVRTLYSESLPTWFLSGCSGAEKNKESSPLEGYAIAHFALLSGALAWGVSPASGRQGARRKRVLGTHMEFLASVLDGRLALGCGQSTWKAYVTGFVALLVTSTPSWVLDVQVDVLNRVAKGLRLWSEQELAIALLERGGSAAMCAAAELA